MSKNQVDQLRNAIENDFFSKTISVELLKKIYINNHNI